MTDDDVLDVLQAAALLKVSRNTLYATAAAGKIPHQRVGRQIRFSRAALVRWLGGAVQGASEGQ